MAVPLQRYKQVLGAVMLSTSDREIQDELRTVRLELMRIFGVTLLLTVLVSLYLALKYPSVFGKVAVVSPSVWWDKKEIVREVEILKRRPRLRIWLDTGTKEGGRLHKEENRPEERFSEVAPCTGAQVCVVAVRYLMRRG